MSKLLGLFCDFEQIQVIYLVRSRFETMKFLLLLVLALNVGALQATAQNVTFRQAVP